MQSYLIYFFTLVAIQLSSIGIFLFGFLLTRNELNFRNYDDVVINL